MGNRIARILRESGIARPEWEARQILAAPGDAEALAKRRALGEPLAYVLGEWDFYGLTLKITHDVLIPRPETELLVDKVLSFFRAAPEEPCRVLDLCCGSGCIGLAIAANCPSVRVTYGDVSEAALEVARRNGCEEVLLLDALSPPGETLLDSFDVLVCNPPYIAPDEELDAAVRDYEPPLALYGGTDGLCFYRALLPAWVSVLKDGGLFVVETGYRQGECVMQIARDAGLTDVQLIRDYAGHGRAVSGRNKNI